MDETNSAQNTSKKPIPKTAKILLIILAVIVTAAVVIGVAVSKSKPTASDYYISDTVKSGSVEFTLLKVEDTNTIGECVTEENFVKVLIQAKNVGNNTVDVHGSHINLYCGNKKYIVSIVGWEYGVSMGFVTGKTLRAGVQMRFWAVFETPTTTEEEDYVLSVQGGESASEIRINMTYRDGEYYDGAGGYY